MERWVEHFLLYSQKNTNSSAALGATGQLLVMEELDETPTKAMDRLPNGKAPRPHGIPPEVIKGAKDTLLGHLYDLLYQCWAEGSVPQDIRDCNIVTL